MARTTATISFQAIELKGSLLPGSLLEQVARLNAPMQKEADYGLAKGERLRERIDAAWVRSKDRSCPDAVHPWGVGGRGDQCARQHRSPADDGCQRVSAPPVVHLCQDANLSQADNTDQRSWSAVDQIIQTENPFANFSAPHQVNDHAGPRWHGDVSSCGARYPREVRHPLCRVLRRGW